MNLFDLKLIFLDLQTTGASPATGAALEIAWALGCAKDDEPEVTTSYLLKQPDDVLVPRRIQALTGIADGDMENAVEWRVVEDELRAAAAKACLPAFVIHYAQFERPFLREMLEGFDDQFQLICTHQIATRLFPNLPSRGIRGLAGYFGFPLEECKRADTHLAATFAIWKHLCGLLNEKQIFAWEELRTWMSASPKTKRTHYEYPLERGIRLSMPDCPGIYKMISCRGDVLYVGKATSLKDRVNSYFRGKKHRDPKKLEMLTQTWDIKIESCPTVLEACLREVQEIKRLAPPYNIALNTVARPLLFYSADYSTCSTTQTDEHPVGPFRNEFVLDGFTRFLNSLRTGEWDVLMFFDELDSQLIADGFELFLQQHRITREKLMHARTALALGLWFCRAARVEVEVADEEEHAVEDDADVELTAEDVVGKFQRLLMRAAHAYLLSRRLTKLLNATVMFTEGGVERTISIHGEQVMDIDTFDLLRVLHTELNRLKKAGEHVSITVDFHSNNSGANAISIRPRRRTLGPKERAYEPA